ncbi:MAG: hypothetical protein AMK72_14955 [Planctomycetes bacterium SM23_25]|nr:MAG: hypothetical protein AMK72_14955 [Planctomycetes bacterium SM23_25]
MTSRIGWPTARCARCLSALAALGTALLASPGAAWADSAADILKATGIQGGLVVHVGCGDGRLTAALRAGDAYLVHGLDTDAANVEKARKHIQSLGLYGPVSVDQIRGDRLPYADHLVNLVVSEALGKVAMAEVMRVLAPLGVAYVKGAGTWRKTVKPWPDEIDQWQQYLHDADNNAVAHDTVVGPPRHLQWVADPAWGRSHMSISTVVSMVSSRGRLFTIEDRATPENPFLPGRFRLIARDAFNGVVLWNHDFADWEPVTRYIKDIAVQLQRRLAAIGDTVYSTPGLQAPLTAFDAATGRIITTYKGTEHTQEFACDGGVLYLVIGDRMNAARYNIVKTEAGKGTNLGGFDPKAPFGGTGFRGAYAPETPDRPDPVCAIAAIDAESGRQLWQRKDIQGYTGCSLAIRGRYAVYQTSGGLVCVNPKTGEKLWGVDKPIQGGDGTEANTLVLSDTRVYAQEGKSLHAYSLKDGSPQWTGPIASNYEKSADLFLAAGALWTGGTKQPTSHDPETGRPIKTIPQRMTGPMSHDRCYRNFITDRYYINSKTGGADFLDLESNQEFPNHWTRGTCGMGVLPCNGLLYAPPYSCQCSIAVMISGFNAMSAQKDLKSPGQKVHVERQVRLVKGPAYGQVSADEGRESAQDWPTYRHDGSRGGATPSKVPANAAPLWKAKLKTAASAPVVAAGKVFVADIHAHTVHALSAADGRSVWSYVAGGRVDSPPTSYRGLVLFGSRDGWVHCLRASDGALVWRFKDLPDRLIGAFGQLESAWPVSGSVLVEGGIAYFAAGRSSFLDGGVFLYGLNPETGAVVHSRQVYGPFDEGTGFPAAANQGCKADILVTDGVRLYMRHKAFNPDLTDAGSAGAHLIPSAGFTDGSPQHRTYWTVGTGFSGKTAVRPPSGDILVTDGRRFYEVRGFPVHRHSYFDPRVRGYELFAGTVGADAPKDAGKGKKKARAPAARPAERWSSDIPLTGKAMVLAGDVLFVAGTPAHFPPDHPAAKYEAAHEGRLGGVLWAASATDGTKLARCQLDAAPTWDGMAAANGRLYVSLADGAVVCLGER